MTYKILSYGPSLSDYKKDHCPTMGVNHIFKFQETDYLVVIDHITTFDQWKLDVIFKSTPKLFLSRTDDWQGNVPNFKQINLFGKTLLPENVGNLESIDDPKQIPYSNNTPFVACILAYHMGAKNIVMYGVDFGDDYEEKHPGAFAIAMRDFTNLNTKLNERGCKLFVSSNKSRLSEVIPTFSK